MKSFNKFDMEISSIESRLIRIIDNNKLGHAYLFYSPVSGDKSDIAGDFAKAIMCDHRKEESLDICGTCNSCSMITKGVNPDFVEYDTRGEMIKVDDIRAILKSAYVKPMYSKRKVYLIRSAELMNMQAQNALLKVLEEPPQNVVFILTTANDNLLLETIKSRTVIFKLLSNTVEQVKKEIENQSDIPDIIANYSGGSIEKARKLLAIENLQELRKSILKYIVNLNGYSFSTFKEREEFFNRNQDNIDIIFDIMQSVFRDMIISQYNGNIINTDMEDEIISTGKLYDRYVLYSFMDAVEQARRNVKSNVRCGTAAEALFIKLKERSE